VGHLPDQVARGGQRFPPGLAKQLRAVGADHPPDQSES
jgi:hypothetical protein